MSLEIFDCEQGTDEWFRARMGIPTASEFATVLAKGRKGEDSKTRKTYMLKLAGEILTGEPMEHYGNVHTDRGTAMEPEARDLYSLVNDVELQKVGFIRCNERKAGASPDSLIGDDGILEIKTKLPHLHIDCLLRGEFPPEHRAQCQGQLWVTDREWCDLAVYWPGLPLIVRRMTRDKEYITELGAAVRQFNEELAEVVEKVRGYSAPAPIKRALAQSLEAEDGRIGQ